MFERRTYFESHGPVTLLQPSWVVSPPSAMFEGRAGHVVHRPPNIPRPPSLSDHAPSGHGDDPRQNERFPPCTALRSTPTIDPFSCAARAGFHRRWRWCSLGILAVLWCLCAALLMRNCTEGCPFHPMREGAVTVGPPVCRARCSRGMGKWPSE